MFGAESSITRDCLYFSILGPLQVLNEGHPLALGSRKQQVVLAALLVHANNIVPVDSLVEALWMDAPPRKARKNIQVYVSVLRRLLDQARSPVADPAADGARISYRNDGYVFRASAAELDSLAFQQQAQAGLKLRRSRNPAAVADALAAALGLWQGRTLDGLRGVPLIDAVAERLELQYLSVFEHWAEAEVAAGDGAEIAEDIAQVAAEHPLRERLRILEMTALCQAGRRSEALAVYDELRQSLARELGLSPGPAMVAFYQSLLHQQEPDSHGSAASEHPPVPPILLPQDLSTLTGRAGPTRHHGISGNGDGTDA